MTNKQIVSEIINDLRAMQIDDRVSERYILSKLRYYLGLFLKRENDSNRLFYYDNIWTTVNCVEMEEVSVAECLGYTDCKITRVTRSKKPIPELYSYKNGPLVKEVFAINEGNDYKPSSQIDYNKILKREFKDKTRYYWFRNNHLIIPEGPDVVLLTGCFIQESAALALCEPETCLDIMEDNFPCPAHLQSVVKQETLKDLFNFYKRTITDTIPDANNTRPQQNSKYASSE